MAPSDGGLQVESGETQPKKRKLKNPDRLHKKLHEIPKRQLKKQKYSGCHGPKAAKMSKMFQVHVNVPITMPNQVPVAPTQAARTSASSGNQSTCCHYHSASNCNPSTRSHVTVPVTTLPTNLTAPGQQHNITSECFTLASDNKKHSFQTEQVAEDTHQPEHQTRRDGTKF